MKNRKAELEAEIARNTEIINDRYERINRGETDLDDCFVSQRFNELAIQVAKTKLQLLENGGTSEFPCLRDLETGEVVTYTTVNGRYGQCWLVDEKFRTKFGTFLGIAARASTYHKKGLEWSTVELPAWVTTKAQGSGMAGAFSSVVTIYPTRKNYAHS